MSPDGPRIDLRQLRFFVSVASLGNFTGAAKLLGIAQPPLSRAIQQLEAEVGVELIDRSARPLRLTAAGELFYEQAQQLLNRTDEMRATLRRAFTTTRRQFIVGFVPSTMYTNLSLVICEFRRIAPDVDLRLREMTSVEQITALKEGIIDVGFGRMRLSDDAVTRILLREEPLVAAVPAADPLGEDADPISLARLAQEVLILYPAGKRPSYADQVLSIFGDHGLAPRIGHYASELQIAIGLVGAHEGVCIVPESAQRATVDNVRFRKLEEPATSPIFMSHRANEKSSEIDAMGAAIAGKYQEWGYPMPKRWRASGSFGCLT